MFFRNRTITVPTTFKECYQEDSVSRGLWSWCETIEKLGNILFYLIIVCGLITSFMGSNTKRIDYYGDVESEFNFVLFLTSMIVWVIYAVLAHVAKDLSVLMISSLATMVQNTTVTAKVALYNASKNGEVEDNKTSVARNNTYTGKEWVCKKCGAKNPEYQMTCKDCGEYK